MRMLVLLVISSAHADWSALFRQAGDQLANDFGFDSFDSAVERAQRAFEPPPAPQGNDPLSAGQGAAEPSGNDFNNDNPFAKMYGCALNRNEDRRMCWSTAGVWHEDRWCWLEYDCRTHSDCEGRRHWMACYGDKMLKGTDKATYNYNKLRARYSKDGL